MSDKPEPIAQYRISYRERERVVNEFCTCDWVMSNKNGIITRHELYRIDDTCPLHSDHAKEAPF